MMLIIYLALIFFFSFLLIKASDILLVNFQSLSQRTKLRQFALTSFLLGLATSLPELFVGITSALAGKPNLSLGNVIGSNIADLSLVIGGAALVGGVVQIRGAFLTKDVFYVFLAGAAPMVLLFDKTLSRLDGFILLALYGFYQMMIFTRPKQPEEVKESFPRRLLDRFWHPSTRRELSWIFLGTALLLFSADMLVKVASKMASLFNTPLLLIGLFLVAVGTSLPELAFSLRALRKHHPTMVFGNLLGSVVANGTLVVGLTAIISPIRIIAFDDYLLATMAFAIVFGIFYFFIRTKHKLERWEAAFLIAFYCSFLLSELIATR